MIKDGPGERRKFADSALCQIKSGYRNILKEYNKALAQRNSLLKDIAFNSSLSDMLYIWDKSFAKYGAKIIYQRQNILRRSYRMPKKFLMVFQTAEKILTLF